MPYQSIKKPIAIAIAVGCGLVVLVAAILWSLASASTASSLYSYTLDGSSGTIANGAAANNNVNLNLYGNWSKSDFGVHFTGNTTNQQSVGYAKPASGYTLDVAAGQSVGSIVKFKYQAPAGKGCFNDSSNISQIGKFASGTTQLKIQFSNCGNNASQVFVQCRIAGANTTSSELPKTNTQALVDGSVYVAKCFKNPDPYSGSGTMTLSVTKLDSLNGNSNTTNIFAITRPGLMRSTQYLSVAQKYPLPSISSNTDQFIGDISKAAYCKGDTALDVETCLDTEVPAAPSTGNDPTPPPAPEPTPTPVTTEWITNQGIETNLTGWTGVWGSASKMNISRSAAAAHSGAAAIKVLGLSTASNMDGGFKGSPNWVANTDNSKTYTASAWVKPGLTGQKINLALRELNGSTLVSSKLYSLTANSTNWVQIAGTITPKMTGNKLLYAVYASDLDAKEFFYADDFSIITTN